MLYYIAYRYIVSTQEERDRHPVGWGRPRELTSWTAPANRAARGHLLCPKLPEVLTSHVTLTSGRMGAKPNSVALGTQRGLKVPVTTAGMAWSSVNTQSQLVANTQAAWLQPAAFRVKGTQQPSQLHLMVK